jgi:hypothetical protein
MDVRVQPGDRGEVGFDTSNAVACEKSDLAVSYHSFFMPGVTYGRAAASDYFRLAGGTMPFIRRYCTGCP